MTISPAVSKTDTPFTFQYDYEYERMQEKAAANPPVPSLIDSWLSMESANSQDVYLWPDAVSCVCVPLSMIIVVSEDTHRLPLKRTGPG